MNDQKWRGVYLHCAIFITVFLFLSQLITLFHLCDSLLYRFLFVSLSFETAFLS